MNLQAQTGWKALFAPFGIGLVFALLFVVAITTAMRSPKPHDLPVGLVAPAPVAAQLRSQLDTHATGTFAIHAYSDEPAARAAVGDGREDGAFVVTGRGARLILASARGAAITGVIRTAFTGIARSAHLPLTVEDARPMPAADPEGTLATVLLIPMILASLIVAVLGAILAPGVSAAARLGLMTAYAITIGALVTLIAHLVEGGVPGNEAEVAASIALFVLAMTATVACLQRIAGAAGTGIAVLVLLVLGLPSAGVFAPPEFLPDLYRAVSPYLPPGAAVALLRDVLYLGGDGMREPAAVLAIWAAAGIVLALLADDVLPRPGTRRRPAAAPSPDADAVLAAMIYLAIRRRDPEAPVPDAVRAQLTSLLDAKPRA